MASGTSLVIFTALCNEPPITLPANFDVRNNHPVLNYDAAVDWFAVFRSALPRSYAGGGVTVYLHWAAATAVTGNCIWDVAWERIGEGIQDIDADNFSAVQSVTAAAPATSGLVDIAAVTFTNGAQMGSVAVGEMFRLRVSRDANNASDTMAGLAQLLLVELKET